ncbi:MAG: hypothetical protein KDC07_03535, partial [Chitinophagaceae bacterium]|nr:hypothetical protein [Chitinophagaceae bacterium]
MKKTSIRILLCMLLAMLPGQTTFATLSGTYTIDPGGTASSTVYLSLTSAISDITGGTRADGGTPNGAGVSGPVIFELASGYTSSGETFPLTLGAVSGASSNNTITIRPASAVSSMLNVSASNGTAIFYINGGQYWTVDGRPGGSGSSKLLTISNTNTGGSTVRFINEGSNNTLRYCRILGNNGSTSSGVIDFATSTATNGNRSNLIDYCNVADTSSKPTISIYSSGTSGKGNDSNIISNSEIYNSAQYKVQLTSIGGTGWTISNNSFYNNYSSGTSNQYFIYIFGTGGHTINYNYMGGQQAACGGSACALGNADGEYHIINLESSTTTSTVHGNTIQNFVVTSGNSCNFYCVYLSGVNANIDSNVMGHATTTNSIVGGNTRRTKGVFAQSQGSSNSISVTNNIIANISGSFPVGIYVSGGSATITDNQIYNLYQKNTSNSGTFAHAYGVYLAIANSTSVLNNKIYNIANAATSSGTNIFGIFTDNGSSAHISIINNVISLTNGSSTASHNVIGIWELGSSTRTINYNSIFIGGTGAGATQACYAHVGSSTPAVRNNIFYNERTGNSYAIYATSSGWSSSSSDYNLFVVSNLSSMGFYGSTKTLAQWQSSPGCDANSTVVSSSTLSASALFTDSANGDLTILSAARSYVIGKGTTVSVTTDYDGTTRNSPPSLGAYEYSFNTWNGSTWSLGAPDSTTDVAIGSSTAPATFSCNNININSGFTLNTGTSDNVTIYGNLTNNGNGATGTGTITFTKNGTAIISGDTFDHQGTVVVESGCTLTTNSLLRLLSDTTATGTIGESAGTISGNVFAQRANKAKKCYRLYAHPFTSAIALSQVVEEIDITGTGGATNGFTTTYTNASSAYWFDPTAADTSTSSVNSGWTAFTSANTASWDQYEVMLMYVRGTKGEGLTAGAYNPSASMFEVYGGVNQGTQVVTLTKGTNTSFGVCGNPFPCGVQMQNVSVGSNIGANYYVWDASSGVDGAWVTNAFSNSYILQPFAGFFTTLTATDNITFEEQDKASGGSTVFKGTAQSNWVELLISDSTTKWDRLLINFDDNGMDVHDNKDAKKLY